MKRKEGADRIIRSSIYPVLVFCRGGRKIFSDRWLSNQSDYSTYMKKKNNTNVYYLLFSKCFGVPAQLQFVHLGLNQL